MGGPHPNVPVKPSAAAQSQSKSQLKEMPDTVDHPDQWIKAEMDRVGHHPCWWKEIRAIKKYTLESAPKKYTMESDLSKPKALYFSQWQAVAFRLPLAQQEVSRWWDSPPVAIWLHPQDFLPHADVSGRGTSRLFSGKIPSPSLSCVMLCREVEGIDWSLL